MGKVVLETLELRKANSGDSVAVIDSLDAGPQRVHIGPNEFATVAEAVAAVTAYPNLYTQVRIKERANSLWDVVTGETPDGYGVISAGSKQLVKLPSNPDIQSAVASADIVTVLTKQIAINAEKNQRGVIVDADIVSDSGLQRVDKLSDAELTGDYESDLYGVLRGYKNNGQSPVFTGIDAGVKPRHLKRMSSVDNPKVVFFGSSSFTYSPNVINKFSSVPAIIQKKLQQDNENKSFTFVNRAIVGTTFLDADGIPSPSAWPSWYTVTTAPWLDYIESEQPDVVFIGFGANDREDISLDAVRSVVSKIQAFSKVPDIIFYTHFVPSLEHSATGSEEDQEGSDIAAGFIRSYARYNDFGLIDCNRVANIVRDSFDPCRLIWKRHEIKSNAGLNIYYGPMCHGWMTRILIEGADAAEVLAKYTSDVPYFTIGRRALGDTDKLYLYESSATPGTIRAVVSLGASDTQSYETGIVIPSETHWLEFAVSDNMVYLGIYGQDEWIWQQKIVRRYGMFPIEMGYENAGDTSPARQLVVNLGVPVTSKKQITGTEMFGSTGAVTTKLPWGGNGANHMSHIGIERVVGCAVDCIDFSANSPSTVAFGLSANKPTTAGSNLRVEFDTKLEGMDGIENGFSGFTGYFVAKKSGVAAISFTIAVAAETVGTNPILAELQINNQPVLDARENPNGSTMYLNGTVFTHVNVGDSIRVLTARSGTDDYTVNSARTRLSIMFSE